MGEAKTPAIVQVERCGGLTVERAMLLAKMGRPEIEEAMRFKRLAWHLHGTLACLSRDGLTLLVATKLLEERRAQRPGVTEARLGAATARLRKLAVFAGRLVQASEATAELGQELSEKLAIAEAGNLTLQETWQQTAGLLRTALSDLRGSGLLGLAPENLEIHSGKDFRSVQSG